MHVPVSPKKYDTRPAAALGAVPTPTYCNNCSSCTLSAYSLVHAPTYTPTTRSGPCSSCSGFHPALSAHSHPVSSSILLLGSIAVASRGEIPKKLASNCSTPSKNPPHLLTDFP